MPFYPNDMLTSSYLIGAVNDRPSQEAIRQSYRGLDLLPWEEVPSRQVIWDVMYSENNLAGFYGPRGEAIPGDEVTFSTEIATLADIKASRMLEKWSLSILRDAGMPAVYKAGGSSNTVQGLSARVADHINKRLNWCNEAVDAQLEYMAMQALQGTMTWPPVDNDGNAIANPMPHWNANYVISIPFNLPAAQNQAVTTLSGYNSRTGAGLAWTNASATPFNDLDIANQYMVKTFGTQLRGGRVIMSSVVLNYLTRNTEIVQWIAGTNREQPGARGFASVEEIEQAIKTRFGWTLEMYDSQWTYRTHNPGTRPTIQRIDFLTEGKVLILPPGGPVGRIMTAQQESEPNGQWVYGKMGWSYTAPKPPYDVELGVNLVAWPRFEHYDWFVLDAYN